MNVLLKSFWKSLIWLLLICYLSLTPSESLPKIPRLFEYDKIGHLMLYLIFSVLVVKSILSIRIKLSLQQTKLLVFFVSIFIGALIEILQANFIRNRNGDITDFLADALGSVLGLLLYNYVAKQFYRLI